MFESVLQDAWIVRGPYLLAFLAFAITVYIFETYLEVRQHVLYKIEKKPKELEHVSQEEFSKAQAYNHDKSFFGFVVGFWQTLKALAMVWYGALPALWYVALQAIEHLGYDASYEKTHTVAFFIIQTFLETFLDLPISWYKIFVIEAKHGFNKQTFSLFVTDNIKSLVLSFIIGSPLLALFILVVHVSGASFYIYATVFLFVVQIIAVMIYPTFIQPLFNKVEPLPEGSLRTKIEALAASIHFPLTQLYTIDGSKRSSHSNAYMYGFFKSKRIVIFDTLIQQCADEIEVVAVLAHELGHWKLNHTVKNLILSQFQTLAMFAVFSQFINNDALYRDFGFGNIKGMNHSAEFNYPVFIGFTLFMFVYSPASHVLNFLSHILSRKFEFEADAFAKKLNYAAELSRALIILQKENKSTMIPDPWYSAYHYSHPPILERLKALEDNKKNL